MKLHDLCFYATTRPYAHRVGEVAVVTSLRVIAAQAGVPERVVAVLAYGDGSVDWVPVFDDEPGGIFGTRAYVESRLRDAGFTAGA